uniref:Uncharacterized protein n=1 Tax=Oryza rufipogon TaxID=4529 RepID=A0A0E0Q858_ORYRU
MGTAATSRIYEALKMLQPPPWVHARSHLCLYHVTLVVLTTNFSSPLFCPPFPLALHFAGSSGVTIARAFIPDTINKAIGTDKKATKHADLCDFLIS